MKLETVIAIILALISGFFGLRLNQSNASITAKETLLSSMRDSLELTEIENQGLNASLEDMVFQNEDLQTLVAQKDESLDQALERAKSLEGQVRYLSSLETEVEVVKVTETIIQTDTFYKAEVVEGNLIDTSLCKHLVSFKSSYVDEFIDYTIQSNSDSTYFDGGFFLEINQTNYSKRKNIFSPTEYFTDLTFNNPYIKNASARTISFVEKPKQWNLSLSGGYGVGLNDGVILTPFIGLTLGKTLIRF